jgi:FkbM family methyltransferase
VDHRTYIANEESRGAIPIEMVALDDYFKPGERVDMIKLDIQGYELHALRWGKTRSAGKPQHPAFARVLALWSQGGR